MCELCVCVLGVRAGVAFIPAHFARPQYVRVCVFSGRALISAGKQFPFAAKCRVTREISVDLRRALVPFLCLPQCGEPAVKCHMLYFLTRVAIVIQLVAAQDLFCSKLMCACMEEYLCVYTAATHWKIRSTPHGGMVPYLPHMLQLRDPRLLSPSSCALFTLNDSVLCVGVAVSGRNPENN